MIIRSRVVVTMNGAPVENGAIAIDGARIIAVGAFPDIRADYTSETIDLGEQIVLPGLINAHCHLDYTSLRGAIPRQPSFADWIRAINETKRSLTDSDYVASITTGFREALSFGTTTLVNYTAFPELIARVESPIRTWWCPELIDVRPGTDSQQLINSAREHLAATECRGIAPHAPYTASAEIYRAGQRLGTSENFLRTTHVAESFDELQMFLHASGALFDFLKEIGRDMSDCGGVTPFARAVQLCGGANDWLCAHVNELTADDAQLLERIERLHVAHCPRSHGYFRHAAFQFERLRDAGANVCLGTDSLASAPDLNLFAEMREFRRLHPHVAAQSTLEMATLNAAGALGRTQELGRVAPGAFADMIALPFTGAAADSYEAILAHEGPVAWTMRSGEILNSAFNFSRLR
jgi:cytosine/adenosine deaminase-related metal-dependent hydrolase